MDERRVAGVRVATAGGTRDILAREVVLPSDGFEAES